MTGRSTSFIQGTEPASKGGEPLRKFLLDVGLSWPQKSAANRQQLLDLLVKLSLDLGMPTLWKFSIGRHPSKPTENTLYMALDTRYTGWSSDLKRLEARDALHRHLRRAAEVVGGIGKSYSGMIEDVLTTHEQFKKVLQHGRARYRVPGYVNLSDYDLRLAINGHLPDDSQLWIDDTIVDMQPGLFSAIDKKHLRDDAALRRFKLYLGAYLVWAVSPVLASHLDHAMHVDMGHQLPALKRKTRDCLASVSHLMPLVIWKVQSDYVKNQSRAWHVLSLLVRSAVKIIRAYSAELAAQATEATSHLAINALNMTVTWSTLDQIYDFIPADAGNGSYFDHYRRAAQAAMRVWKKSLRRPQLSFYHLPGTAREAAYRILVIREVTISFAYLVPPMMVPDHPLAVSLATMGTQMASDVQVLLQTILLYDDQFSVRGTARMTARFALYFGYMLDH
ncbi:hypothetical protein V5799_032724 [Amblyomma americanum]|uniref:Peptidase M13 N-terminal domain-containing protein n=1 Tax=Amblyomma americanum TaxID=6943 RepID=A0AAQ4DQD0_AMBAM